jgi:hypothetical protein
MITLIVFFDLVTKIVSSEIEGNKILQVFTSFSF